MMDPKDLPQGGPAFPTSNAHQNGPSTFHFEGMTLRDYFAAKAMQSLIVDPERIDQSCEECARLAYRMADAMRLERDK